MKLHSLRIENLNSLRGTHEIAFERLFNLSTIVLIAGETGAGKSTILDAIHLALFGRTPRLQDSARSTRSEETSVQHVMTRGTGECSVCLEFSVEERDGSRSRYQAMWSLHRAHKKADGRVQDPRHSLAHYDEATDRFVDMLEDGRFDSISAARTHALRGMTEDDFLRSVLLPQGQFDALLTADEKARGDALRRIVPVEHIEHIGQKVAEFASEAKRALEAEEQRVGAQQDELLSDDILDEHRQTLEDVRTQIASTDQQLARVQTRVNWKKTCEDLEEKHRLCAAALARVQHADLAVSDDRHRLQEHQRLEGAALQWTRCEERQTRLATLKTDAETAQKQASATHQRLESAEQAWTRDNTALHDATKQHAAQQPDLQRATEAWKAFEDAQRTAQQSDEKLRETQTSTNEEQSRLTQRKQKLLADQKSLGELRQALERFQLSKSDLQAKTTIETLLSDEREASATHRASQKPLHDAHEALAQLHKETTARNQESEDAVRAWKLWQNEAAAFYENARWLIAPARHHEDKISVEEVHNWADQLTDLQTHLGDYGRELKAHGPSLDARERLIADLRKDSQTLEAAKQRFSAAEKDSESKTATLKLQQELLTAHTKNLDAQKRYLELVKELDNTDVCPVCGTKSPAQHAEERRQTVQTLIEQLQKDIDSAHIAVQRAQEAKDAADRVCTEQRDALTRAKTTVDQLHAQQKTLDKEIAAQRAALQESEMHAYFPSAASAEEVHTDVEKLRDRFAQVREDQRRANALAQRGSEMLHAHRSAQAALTQLAERRETAQTRRTNAQKSYDDAHASLERWTRRAHTALDTASFLRWKPQPQDDLVASVESLRHQLRDLNQTLEDYAAASAKLEPLIQAVRAAEQEVQEQQERVQHAETAQRAAQEQRDAAHATRDQTQKSAHSFFDGVHPETIKNQWEQTLDQLRAALESARVQREQALEQHHAAHTALTHAQTRRDEVENELSQQQETLDRTLKQLDVPSVDALLERRLDPSNALNLQEKLSALDEQKKEAALEERLAKEALEAHHKLKETIGEPTDEDASQLLELKESLEQMHQQQGRIDQLLRADGERKKKLEEAGEKLQTLRVESDEWDHLRQLVGVRQGAAFSDFALALSLGELIAHANEQLEIIAPRYTLQQRYDDAGVPLIDFEILDHDFSADIRPISNLSGGERFQLSLAMALGLSSISRTLLRIETLLIDEGFGTLDPITLDKAIQTLEGLYQRTGARVALISHVERLRERLPIQIIVRKRGGGHSVLDVRDDLAG